MTAPAADYVSKLSTVIAGGDLPDLMLIAAKLPNRAEMLTRLCADLTGFVSGGAIRDYPFLANLPTDSWLPTMYKGGIYAIPISRSVIGTIMFSRQDLITERSLNPAPKSFAEFSEVARGLTDAKANRWAFGSAKGVITFVGNMLGVPNVWRKDGNGFVSELEVPERKEAVARVAEMVKGDCSTPMLSAGSCNCATCSATAPSGSTPTATRPGTFWPTPTRWRSARCRCPDSTVAKAFSERAPPSSP